VPNSKQANYFEYQSTLTIGNKKVKMKINNDIKNTFWFLHFKIKTIRMQFPTDLLIPYLETLVAAHEHAANNVQCAHVAATIITHPCSGGAPTSSTHSNTAIAHAEMVALSKNDSVWQYREKRIHFRRGRLRHYDYKSPKERRESDGQTLFRLPSGFASGWNPVRVLHRLFWRVGGRIGGRDGDDS
jgi:hypothetical protein